MDTAKFEISTEDSTTIIRYTIDGSDPTTTSSEAKGVIKIVPGTSFLLKASCFLNGKVVSDISEQYFSHEKPISGTMNKSVQPGLLFKYYEGEWSMLPDFTLQTPIDNGIFSKPDISKRKRESNYGIVMKGYLKIPKTGVYKIYLTSDDGSCFTISGKTLLNDGLHGMETKTIDIALEEGLHPVEILFFQKGGGDGLEISWKTGDTNPVFITGEHWFH